ncbi:hypothetical protein [Flavobacterium quisquiliarum]|uniref:Lumazine-binding n=1 Tax=Flavobacterium quisquiliarum TaxID=1834436 RepID=A0ABV8W6N0_9FLAO|nr:hypothetical protein [Flavobacterium quisquiliarum]MBW1655512.1 hypothetical protein [Flavobacterium quisquiliarum]NWL03136.1 hypothetical protein [Flavobacterium collinsii]
MKNIIFIFIVLTFYNCQNKKENYNLSAEKIKDINEVVEAVIIQDSLDVFSKNEDSAMFCNELKKLNIFIPEKRKDGIPQPPPPPQDIYITSLLSDKTAGETFSPKDSLYLLNQNLNPEKLEIEDKLINKLNSTTIEEMLTKRKKHQLYRFYQMTIPVFSIDRKLAYIQLNYHCAGLCGSGKAIYLKKVNGKWKIIEKWETWIS